jgi:membrane-bound metal-dependent hydrolase YbcI (DUF457 family)
MASPIGHALAGYAIYKIYEAKSDVTGSRRALLSLALFMAIAPDLDFGPGILIGQPALYHQLITHSIGAAFVVSIITAGLFRSMGMSFSIPFNLCFVSYLSHLAIDFFAPDARPPYGQPLFWPLTGAYFMSPVWLFLGVQHSGSTEASTVQWLTGVLSLQNLWAIAIEVIFVGPCAVLATVHRRVTVRLTGLGRR